VQVWGELLPRRETQLLVCLYVVVAGAGAFKRAHRVHDTGQEAFEKACMLPSLHFILLLQSGWQWWSNPCKWSLMLVSSVLQHTISLACLSLIG
jgi:hypothetical protein